MSIMPTNYNENDHPPSGLLRVSEVARVLNVHPNTVRNWSDKGLIKTYRLGYRVDRRFSREDIHEFLASQLM